MLPKFVWFIVIWPSFAWCQPFYTPVRAAFGGAVYGISPKAAATAEASFGYLEKSFWNVEAGLGAITTSDFRSPSLSGALTHCLVLNPYKRKQCRPAPGNYLIETYLEAGLGGFLVDRYDNGLFYVNTKQRLFTPSGLLGLRLHVVTGKWIYMLKVRLTPPLLRNRLATGAGLGLALGWR